MKFSNFAPIIEVPFGQRAEVMRPIPEFYQSAGEGGIHNLIDAHYELLKVSDGKQPWMVNTPE